jgi:hypothetical protein
MLDWAYGVAGEFAQIANAVRPGLSLIVTGGLGKLNWSLQWAGFQTTPPTPNLYVRLGIWRGW